MKQHQFEALYQKQWQEFDKLLEQEKKSHKHKKQLSQGTKTNQQGQHHYEFIRLYRMICQHYALAKQRHYSPMLVQKLNKKVIEGHQLLYRHKTHFLSSIADFIFFQFPNSVRSHMPLFWLSLALSLLPAILAGWASYHYPHFIYSLIPDDMVKNMEFMYNPSNNVIGREAERYSDTDLMMFGYYIYHNIGIDFQIYASGLFAGIGTMISLVYNGLVFGGISGFLTNLGYGVTFWPFVVGHGSFELTGMVISGMAGLRLAQALFMPGNYRRLDAFKIAGKDSIVLLIGASLMTFIAAFIEAFWSSSSVIPNAVKYGVAIFLWGLVFVYLRFSGRRTL